jgi:hypothetical protein
LGNSHQSVSPPLFPTPHPGFFGELVDSFIESPADDLVVIAAQLGVDKPDRLIKGQGTP